MRGPGLGPQRMILSCHHDRVYNQPLPSVGDQVYCTKCAEYRQVTGTVQGWYIRCQTCPMGHTYGEARLAATQAARRHKDHNVTHVVAVFHNGKLNHVLGNTMENVLDIVHLDDDGGIIPF